MLTRADTAADALGERGTAAVETRFDGARVQVHRDADGEVSLFSRNVEDVTDALPEMVEFIADAVGDPVILDGGVVMMGDGGEPLPPRGILRRFRREHDVDRMHREVQIRLRALDCLHAADDDLLTDPLAARHGRLAVPLDDDSPTISDLLLSDDSDETTTYETDAPNAGHEDIMLKGPNALYSPGDHGRNWLEHKPDVEMLGLIVTGMEWGEGRHAGFLGMFPLSTRAEVESGSDAFEIIGKVATGTTDEELAELTDPLEPEIEHRAGKEVDIRPSIVLEVDYKEIQTSPTCSPDYMLRFLRLVTVREDKIAGTADSLDRMERLTDLQ